MLAINTANVINLLITTFHIANLAVTPVNHREVELHDAISNLIRDSLKDDITIEYDWGLDFDDPSEPQAVQFVDLYDPHAEEDNYEDEVCIVDDEGGSVDLNYKRKAVEYWNSGKKRRLSVSVVQNRFRKVKHVSQLYRWQEYIMRVGTNRDKLIFIAEYVLIKFQETIDRGSIIHDIDLRRWALEAKEQVNFATFKAGHWWI
ncbi:uncharacterized protein LOC114941451 [Nylanderia fulva]|uniref:uncharacterized protein LOC114941451 n=1 Tax=Nylanderia fulva TaxID=613905 RepID=UPI0010FB06AF|nr:uncharacterized protein LOC114941451 [Nylanderia fulva]